MYIPKGICLKLISFILFCIISIVYIGFFIYLQFKIYQNKEYNKVQNQNVKFPKTNLDVSNIIQATNITNSVSSKIPLIFFW